MRACMYEPAFEAASCALSAMRRAFACALSLMASMRRSSMTKLLLPCSLSVCTASYCVNVRLLCQRTCPPQATAFQERRQRLRVIDAPGERIAEPAQALARVADVEVLGVGRALELRPLHRHRHGGGGVLAD